MVFLGMGDNITYPLRDIVKRTIEFRERHNVIRKDLLQLLIQLRNTGKISDDTDKLWDIETSAKILESMSIEQIAAQAFLFYIAGSETTAATAAYTIYELAMSPKILECAQNEVDQCLLKHGLQPEGKLTYAALYDMKYLDLCIMGEAIFYIFNLNGVNSLCFLFLFFFYCLSVKKKLHVNILAYRS